MKLLNIRTTHHWMFIRILPKLRERFSDNEGCVIVQKSSFNKFINRQQELYSQREYVRSIK